MRIRAIMKTDRKANTLIALGMQETSRSSDCRRKNSCRRANINIIIDIFLQLSAEA
jgi:hypothetical protein